MRAAPAVDYPLSPGGLWRRGCALLGSAVSGVVAFWAASFVLAGAVVPTAGLNAALPMALAVSLSLLAALAGGWLTARLARSGDGVLRWDGGQWWRLPTPHKLPESGRPEVVIDWGGWILLRWYPSASDAGLRAGACLALSCSEQPARWHLLRVALLQSGRRAGTSPAQPAALASGDPA